MANSHSLSGWKHTRPYYSEDTDSYPEQLDFNTFTYF